MHIRLLSEQNYAHTMNAQVLPALRSCQREGWLTPAQHDAAGQVLPQLRNEGSLHYVVYEYARFQSLHIPGTATELHGTVVIAHGFCEFIGKYDEMAWYLLLAGFNVCIMEHRGHGYSARDVADTQVVYIDHWQRYVADYAKFVQEVGRPVAGDKPLYLFSHSMGGGISAAMMERYPNIVDRAVLSSPMIQPRTGAPNWLAYRVCEMECKRGRSWAMTVGQHPFNPQVDWSKHVGSSRARIQWVQDLRNANPHYQTCAASNSWVVQALQLSKAILNESAVKQITTPILLMEAGRDHWVYASAEEVFVKAVSQAGGSIERTFFAQSPHEIYSTPNVVLAEYLQQILQFYGVSNTTVLPSSSPTTSSSESTESN